VNLMQLILAVLATWRVTHLLALEDGPGDSLARVREQLGASLFGKLMDCFQCMSLWVAAPVALYFTRKPLEWVVAWLGLSGAACLLERIGQEPVVIDRLPEEIKGGLDDGMLRPETRAAHENSVDTRKINSHPSRN